MADNRISRRDLFKQGGTLAAALGLSGIVLRESSSSPIAIQGEVAETVKIDDGVEVVSEILRRIGDGFASLSDKLKTYTE